MRRRSRLLLFAALLCASSISTPASALVAASADDVCAASADPCVVSRPVSVAAGSRLDFGLRALRIEGAGILDFEDGRGAVSCGRLETTTSGVAIRARADSTPAATLSIVAARRCALAAVPCLVDADCEGAGSCSAGDGSVVLRGAIAGNADAPGHVVIRSAADLSIHGAVSLAGTRASSDGGSLALESTQGSVRVAGAVDVSGGGGGIGGDVSVTAFADIAVQGRLTATGGEYDGGAVSLDAGRDVSIAEDIAVDATGGAGAGGQIDVAAGRDLVVRGGTATNNVVLSADGHQSAENDGGDGGAMSFEADGNVRIARDVRFVANAAAPDGFGDALSFSAEGDLEIDAAILARGRGAGGGGAVVDLYAGRDVRVGPAASFDLTGGGAGGDLMVEAGDVFSFEGRADVSGAASAIGGRIVTVSGGDSEVGGSWVTDGRDSVFSVGEIFVEGCRLRIDGQLANAAAAGRNRFVAHESISLAPAASIVASGQGGSNSFVQRSSAPLLAGTVAPPGSLAADPSLAPCAICGNGATETGESCDDGNLLSGDGCNARCQDEGCLTATAGYPATALCDDANACTADRCNAALHRCEHAAADCSDGIDCTTDRCSPGGCVHVANAAACDDANACTADVCDETEGCLHEAAEGRCDDGAFCNGADSCSGGACVVHGGDPCAAGAPCADRCDEAHDSCLAPAGTACGDDAGVCTDDVCDGAGACLEVANAEPCDDADFCTVGERCRDGRCGDDSARPLVVARMRVKTGERPGEDALALKAAMAGDLLPGQAAATSLRLVLSDEWSRPLADVVLSGGAMLRGQATWRIAQAESPLVGKLSIDEPDRDGVARVRARLAGLDASGAMSAESLRLALVFGDEPSGSPCMSSAVLECRRAGRRLACSTPR